ncbi:hypothetical protein [Undibacterium flavidum]|uniref:Uncharacterized protein n=1 Tax=Undibacterium flavidum TaxID=2762297 RepID=A0ABR6YAB1_9BURK|nr:hypothetical protein [Undibacterium flavidum]MBC3873486.1 hypothetical protein [Undibacterium flavidum]
MEPNTLTWINLASAMFAGIAALLWFYSAVVRVKVNDIPDESGFIGSSISDGNGNDILASLVHANFWSACAASAAGVAAILQAVAIWFAA